MKTLIREFLHFSRTEQRGILVLSTGILLLFGYRIYSSLQEESGMTIPADEWRELQKWIAQKEQEPVKSAVYASPTNSKLKLVEAFNPNDISEKDWCEIGFSQKEAASIVKYKNLRNGFRFKDDLKKLYCLSPENYQILEPFILLPSKKNESESFTKQTPAKSNRSNKLLELNAADSLQLIALKGIGPGWAHRILKRRNQLGGFYSISQLTEIKGFSDSLLTCVKTQVEIDSALIQKIKINHISLEEIQKHPYCWYGVGKSIVNYRLQHGPFASVEDLKKIYTLRPEIYAKLVHYILIE